jgi:outer membrane receptor protein involved in Fe transport
VRQSLFAILLLSLFTARQLPAAEFHGTIRSAGLPVPGVTITAAQGDQHLSTSTDEHGVFSFDNLADGDWKIDVEMLGFEKISREIAIIPGAPAAVFDLKFVTLQTRATQPPQNRSTYRQLDVNQSATPAAFSAESNLKTDDVANLGQSSANSFLMQGSISSALGLPQQNDWALNGPGMPGLGPGGMPGSVGGPGMGGPNGDGPGNSPQASMRFGQGGPGGGGPGGPGSGGPPPGGGGPGGGGPGGPGGGFGGPGGGGPGGFGGPGGPGGGFGPRMNGGRPPWEGRPGAMAFGNNRRDPRNMYMVSAFFSLDNSALDARSFSVTGSDVAKPSYANARAGISVGGPLFIPKLVSKDRHILFSLDIQFQRNRTGSVSDAVNMPTALERLGDFSQSTVQGAAVTIYDPTTGAPFAGDKIPTSRISPTALGLLKYYPLPNLTTSTLNYETTLNGENNTHNINARLSNIKLDAADRLNFGIGYQGSDSVTPNLFQFTDTGAGRGLNANAGWSRTITTTLINTVNLSFSRNRQQTSPFFANTQNIAAELGILGTSQAAVNWGPPSISLTNYAGLTDGNYSLNRNQTASAGDSLLWIHGTQTFTFGGDYRRMQFNQYSDNNGRGAYTFNGSVSGYDLTDLLLGLATTSSIRYGNPDKYLRGSGFDLYINDDWRLRPNLSINFGLRYDYATPVSELYNRLVNLSLSSDYTTATAIQAPNLLLNPDRNNFSPRIGIAWRPRVKHSLVVRAGYGVYYNTSVYNQIANNMAQQPPFAQSLSASSSAAEPLTITNAFLLATAAAGSSTYAVDPNYRLGYAQTWNFQLQNDLPFNMFGTLGYLGTKGTRLDQQFIPNSVAPGAIESLYPHSFIYETSNGNSIYNALQAQLNRRFHSGLMWRASYQFSKSIDDAGTGGRGQGNTPVAQNWLDLDAERALSSFDSRHNLTLSVQYSTGMGTQGGTLLNGWKGALLKDWTVSNDITLHSGNPFTATVGGVRSQVSGTAVSNTVRAEATGLNIDSAT